MLPRTLTIKIPIKRKSAIASPNQMRRWIYKVVWAIEGPIKASEQERISHSLVFKNGLPVDYETRYYPKLELNNDKFPGR